MELYRIRFIVRHSLFHRENVAQNVTNEMAGGSMSCVAQNVILCR